MRIFRIADRRHEVWNGTGAMLVGGRFNSPGRPVIYGALTFAGAMLEVLVHARIGKVPRHHVLVVGTVPEDVSVERVDGALLPAGWDTLEDPRAARSFGDRWLAEGRSALLVVPSVVARLEWNALVNPTHSDAARIQVSAPEPVQWDDRLFARHSL
ncbi:RES family NAD+ phosphorylase [Cupriavidus consociatus]|uniref:RES family NAD+ phosphorylase n=1 Tax=Cupriavidus consociatus TaxID=2821357 RepID=UPI001AE488BC|nr:MULTISPECIES: RES domain-containing protein [unclassified Cupriavidus]MBP0624401.1 RES family NAD+ phosphorylase [Cupriavidus sp. LEh25]MDK2661114.1 RES domain-containing protein [Cupriavidus sp. LEh21]